MLRPPQRLSLVAQTAAILKEHLASRPPNERLASERELCHQLGVSRVTLRSALARLADEGLIRSHRGRRRVIARVHGLKSQPETNRDVVLLSPTPLEAVEPRVLLWIDELRDTLAKAGCKLAFLNHRNCYSHRPQQALEGLAARLRPAVWLLHLSTRAIQEWFAARGMPAVIAGSRFEGVNLPAIDVDARATCRHAAGKFLAKGHRCLTILNPPSVAAGDLESELGFREAGASAEPEAETIVAQHDGTVPGICASLDRLLSRARPPTAFLVSRPGHALTALGHLIQRGLCFPEKAALISRDHDWFLEAVVPSVARYRMDPAAFAHKLSRVVLDLTSGGNPPAREHLLMPQFIPGHTLG